MPILFIDILSIKDLLKVDVDAFNFRVEITVVNVENYITKIKTKLRHCSTILMRNMGVIKLS